MGTHKVLLTDSWKSGPVDMTPIFDPNLNRHPILTLVFPVCVIGPVLRQVGRLGGPPSDRLESLNRERRERNRMVRGGGYAFKRG
jgi:hypothetical protein